MSVDNRWSVKFVPFFNIYIQVLFWSLLHYLYKKLIDEFLLS